MTSHPTALWVACTRHGYVGETAGGAFYDGTADHNCTYCVAVTISAQGAAIEALTILVDQMAGVLAESGTS